VSTVLVVPVLVAAFLAVAGVAGFAVYRLWAAGDDQET
jgi:hypothetical protein